MGDRPDPVVRGKTESVIWSVRGDAIVFDVIVFEMSGLGFLAGASAREWNEMGSLARVVSSSAWGRYEVSS